MSPHEVSALLAQDAAKALLIGALVVVQWINLAKRFAEGLQTLEVKSQSAPACPRKFPLRPRESARSLIGAPANDASVVIQLAAPNRLVKSR
jgi:hypothetical protein